MDIPAGLSFTNDPSYGVWVAANSKGFVLLWVDISPGFASGAVLATFTSDLGNTWSTPVTLDNANVFPQITITATESGFLATWWNDSESSIKSAFSSDGTTWGTAVTIDTDNENFPSVPPQAAGNGSNFL